MHSIRQITFREINFPGYSRNIIALEKTHLYGICYCLGRVMIACQTALKDFRSIVMSVGGNDEQERARCGNSETVDIAIGEDIVMLFCIVDS